MHRRTYLRGIVGTTLLGLAGCAGEDGGNANENDSTSTSTASPTESPTSTPTPTRTDTPQREVLIDETIYSRNRYPFDLQAGQRLVISVDVERGGPVIVDVADAVAGESLFSDRVETQNTFEVEIQNSGTHYLTFQNISEANIEVVLVDTN